MYNLTNNQQKFLKFIVQAKSLELNLNKIKKKDKIKELEKRKIFKVAHKNINDNEAVEVMLILIKKNTLLKMAIFFLIKYYIKELIKTNFENNNNKDDDDEDELF